MKVHMLRKIALLSIITSTVSCALLTASPTPVIKAGQKVTPFERQLIVEAKQKFDKNYSAAKTEVQPGTDCTVDRFTCTFTAQGVRSSLSFVEHHKEPRKEYSPESNAAVARLNAPIEVKFIGSDPTHLVLVERKGNHRHLKTVELAEAFNA